MDITLSKKFRKQYKKAPKNIQTATKKRLLLFKKNPDNPILNNHLLTGEYLGLRSINITGNWRALYEQINNSTIEISLLGTHSQLYK